MEATAEHDAEIAKAVTEARMACWACQVDGVVPWSDFRKSYEQWLISNPPNEQLVERLIGEGEPLPLKWFLCITANYFCEGTSNLVYKFTTDVFGKPDIFAKDGKRPLLIGILDVKNVPDDGLRRLYAYMLITGAPFGLLIQNEVSFWYAKLEQEHGHSVQLCVSNQVSSWWGVAFLLDLARKGPQQRTGIVDPETLQKLRLTMGPDARELFKSIAKRATKTHIAAIIEGMKSMKLEDLENLRGVGFRRDSDSEVARAFYKGKQVVLKVRDLTTPWGDIEAQLLKLATEVDVYMTLHKLQGVSIPRLISWGFICNNMFAYLMVSDEGKPMSPYGKFISRQIWEATLPLAQQALTKVHARGVLLGDVRSNKFVYRNLSSGKLEVKVVGFSKASYMTGQSQTTMHVAASREIARLEECFNNVLVHVQAAEGLVVKSFLIHLYRNWGLLDQYPEIKDLLVRLGAKLPTASPAPDLVGLLTRHTLDVERTSSTLAMLVNNRNLLEHPAFTSLRDFLTQFCE